MSASPDEIEEAINEIADFLVHTDEDIASLIAETNANGWGMDEYSEPTILRNEDTVCEFRVTFSISGEQDEDRSYHGDEITAVVRATMTKGDADGEDDEEPSWSVDFDNLEKERLDLNNQD